MPRKLLIRSDSFPYHITNRSNNKEFFYIEQARLWEIFMKCFEHLVMQFECELHAFVLMSNHYHLLISTPQNNIGESMKYLHREVARIANKETHRINHFFGGRYKWSLIEHENYYWNATKYIFQNPVRANLCSSVTDYSFSSLNRDSENFQWMMTDFFHDRKKPIELDKSWLNEVFPEEQLVGIRKALRRREFSLPRGADGRISKLFDAIGCKKGTVT